MTRRHDPAAWMWTEAVDLMDRAERMHRQFFRMATRGAPERPRWEPPVDVYAGEHELRVEVRDETLSPDESYTWVFHLVDGSAEQALAVARRVNVNRRLVR